MFATLRAGIDARIQRAIDRRIRVQTPPFAIRSGRIYILPTRNGLYFGLLVVVMLLGSLNYSNSLGFVVTFTLTGLGLVAMHHTQRNLLRLSLRAIDAEPVFAGETARFELTLGNTTRVPRYAIRLSTHDRPGAGMRVGANAEVTAHVECPAPRRGRLACPRLRLDTAYPLGLFNAWHWMEVDTSVTVYPRPAGELPLPRHGADSRQAARSIVRGDAQFSGHRAYVPGDSPRRIDWKASARTDELIVARHQAGQERQLWLDADSLRHLALEARLSQMARWVLSADAAGYRYGLKLPGARDTETLPPSSGSAHKHACLTALALY